MDSMAPLPLHSERKYSEAPAAKMAPLNILMVTGLSDEIFTEY
jgi:hypothetical protein